MAQQRINRITYCLLVALAGLPAVSAIAQTPHASTPTAEVDTLNVHALRLLEANPDTALKLGFRAVREALQLNYLSGHTQSLLTVGRGYYQLNKYKKALEYFISARNRAAERKQDPEGSDAVYYIGRVYFDWGDYDQSLQYFFRSLALQEKIRDTLRMAHSLNSIGKVYEISGNLDKALNRYNKSLKYYKKIDNDEGIATTLNNLGLIYYKRREYDQALDYHNQSLAIHKQLNSTQGVANSLHHIGDIYHSRGKYSRALNSYFRALQREKKLGYTIGVAGSYNSIARSYFAQKQYDQAINYYGKAATEARVVDAKEPLMRAYRGIADSYAQLKDYQKAYFLQQKYIAVRDSLFNRYATAEIAEIEARYELQNQGQEVKLLRKEQKIQAITLERNRQLNYLLGVLIVLFLVLGLVYLNRYIIKRRANKLLSARNQIIQSQNWELQTMNDKLRGSEENLKNLIATKDKFFTIISHDLRGPLNSLTGLLQILIKHVDGFTREELKQFAINTDRTVRNLRSLLDNLLQWSRTQRGNIRFEPESLHLAQLVQELFGLLEIIAVNKKIALYADIPPDLCVHADRNMLDFVLRNLLDNAIKFTNAGGKVWITAVQQEDKAEISISDTGIGISKEDQDKLFRLDTYHTTSGTSNETGTGLALLICHEFVGRHGDTIMVNSQVGVGTTFSFTLPVHTLVNA